MDTGSFLRTVDLDVRSYASRLCRVAAPKVVSLRVPRRQCKDVHRRVSPLLPRVWADEQDITSKKAVCENEISSTMKAPYQLKGVSFGGAGIFFWWELGMPIAP